MIQKETTAPDIPSPAMIAYRKMLETLAVLKTHFADRPHLENVPKLVGHVFQSELALRQSLHELCLFLHVYHLLQCAKQTTHISQAWTQQRNERRAESEGARRYGRSAVFLEEARNAS